MQQTNISKISGLILLIGGGLQLALLLISIIASLFFFAQGMGPDWSHALTVLLLLAIMALGLILLRRASVPPPLSQRSGILIGLILGIVSAILLYIPGLGMLLAYAALGLPWLIVILITNPATVSSTAPLFALTSVALYIVFAASYCLCAALVVRRGGLVKQGLWNSIQAVLATFLSTALTFSLIDCVAYFAFHRGSSLFAPSSFADFSPLVNYAASYKGIVQLLAFWLLVPAVVSLLLAIPVAFISRGPTFRAAAKPASDGA